MASIKAILPFNIPVDDTGNTCCYWKGDSCPFFGTARFGVQDVCCYPTDGSFNTNLHYDKEDNLLKAKHCPFKDINKYYYDACFPTQTVEERLIKLDCLQKSPDLMGIILSGVIHSTSPYINHIISNIYVHGRVSEFDFKILETRHKDIYTKIKELFKTLSTEVLHE